MRLNKLVEMIKQISREKFDESSHLPSSRYSHEKRQRQRKGLKLAQEEEELKLKADTGGETILTLNPVKTSSYQPR